MQTTPEFFYCDSPSCSEPGNPRRETTCGRHQSILDTIGRTPVVKINKLAPDGINLYAKLEAFNPLGSVKDRLALGVIEDAERSGTLSPGQTVVEATSGNTGIGLAMVCAAKGYPLVVVMAENFSVERRRMMRFLGARVILTPASEKGSGMLAKAVELADDPRPAPLYAKTESTGGAIMKTIFDYSEAGDRRRSAWLGRIGRLGYAFFFIKGMAWLMLPAALWLID